MSSISETKQLEEWYVNFLKLFREEFSKLSDEEKKHISNFHDYHFPCQIEVFWLKQPEWQLIIETHFEDRPDCEITVNGPYDTSVFQDEVKIILNHTRWHVPIDNSEPTKYYSDRLAERLHGFVEMAKNALFMDWKKLNGMTTSLVGKNDIITHFHGNMGDFDYRALIQHIINETNQQLEDSKTQPTSEAPSQKVEYSKGFATYFFPPIIIGKNPRRTVDEIFHGVHSTSFSLYDKEPFDVMFDDIFVLVEKDGFIGVYTDNTEKSLEILNTIMMVFVLDGLETRIVREHELSEIEFDSKTHNIVSRSFSYDSPRNKLFDEIPDKTLEYETRHVDKEHIKKIFEKSSEIFADKNLAEDLRFLLEALTHMKDSEFSQAFIMGWKIIEKHLSTNWHKKQNTINKKIKFPAVDVMINDLKDELQEKFSDFTELRKIRNSYMHGKKIITQEEAQKCVDISKELVLKNSKIG
jgi:hypothetical protein